MKIKLPENYTPEQDEFYMGPLQLEYFKRKLIEMKSELQNKSKMVIDTLKGAVNTQDANYALMNTKNLERTLKDIDISLEKIENKDYGYCENTGEEIGIKRLTIQPIAKYCIEEQERIDRHAVFQKSTGNDYDD